MKKTVLLIGLIIFMLIGLSAVYGQTLGEELVSNGKFIDRTVWSCDVILLTPCRIENVGCDSGGQLFWRIQPFPPFPIQDIARRSDFTSINCPELDDPTWAQMNQSINIEAGKKYNVSFNISKWDDDLGQFKVELGGVNTTVPKQINHNFSFLVKTNNTDDLRFWGMVDGIIYIDDVSVKEVLQPDTILMRLKTRTENKEIVIELKEDTKFSILAQAIKVLWRVWQSR